ncbi:hypothetical protein Zmor_021680 [Zophobas morio]|uniref:CHK kinase-like domain-containing protein n=1 Tax=Zophobas morio TaxID=2755281 RepID=A0AA38I696_9CUCU|nr:hypothetical protein Zmor_021680 [Zophobas morio]
MSGAKDVEKQLRSVVTDATKKLNLSKFTIDLNLNALKGDGFLGEFYKVSVKDDESNSIYYLAIKKAPVEKTRREEQSMDMVYQNEISFYSEIVPAFRQFEQEQHVSKPFDSIARYFTSNSQIGREIIVFEDITKMGYILREKDLLLDDAHAKLIFETYGHYHAISFCLKNKKPEEFARLTASLHPIWKNLGEKERFLTFLKASLKDTQESLNPDEDEIVLEKFRKYVDNTQEIFLESCDYKGQYSGIVHGDCWSNNMMFKYQDPHIPTEVESMKLLDFQLVFASTPVHDLSYFFYTSGCKKLFDKLEEYLDIYYQSFSKFASELGCDPHKLLPREMLSQDWKKYSQFGMMLSTILTKIKLISKEDSIKIIEAADNQKEGDKVNESGFEGLNFDSVLFKQRVRDIVIHMHEIDAL